jgi:hypothetical protein
MRHLGPRLEALDAMQAQLGRGHQARRAAASDQDGGAGRDTHGMHGLSGQPRRASVISLSGTKGGPRMDDEWGALERAVNGDYVVGLRLLAGEH